MLKHNKQTFIFYYFRTVKIAGNGTGFQNGPLNLAKFNNIYGIVLNPSDDCLYISDYNNHCIRKLNNEGMVNFTYFQQFVYI